MENITEKLFENEDDLKKLIQKEGLLTTSPDFTRRVMMAVDAYEKKSVIAYKPLLSRKTWFFLITSLILLLLCCMWAISGGNTEKTAYSEAVRYLFDAINDLNFSLHFNAGGLLIATIVIASIGALLCLDILLTHKYREVSV